jgi:hypothetical protein
LAPGSSVQGRSPEHFTKLKSPETMHSVDRFNSIELSLDCIKGTPAPFPFLEMEVQPVNESLPLIQFLLLLPSIFIAKINYFDSIVAITNKANSKRQLRTPSSASATTLRFLNSLGVMQVKSEFDLLSTWRIAAT